MMKLLLTAAVTLLPLTALAQTVDTRWYKLKVMDAEFFKPDGQRKLLTNACARVDLQKEIDFSKRVVSGSTLLRLEIVDGPEDDKGKVNGVKVSIYGPKDPDDQPTQMDFYYRSKLDCADGLELVKVQLKRIHEALNAKGSKYK